MNTTMSIMQVTANIIIVSSIALNATACASSAILPLLIHTPIRTSNFFSYFDGMHITDGAPFDLTILVPKARFTSSSSSQQSSSSSNSLDDYVSLFLPATDVDVLRDIKQSVADSAEGFWIGSHSYQRINIREEAPAQEGDEPKLFLEGEASETFPDTTDLATVFAGEEYKSGELRRALKAVQSGCHLVTDPVYTLKNHELTSVFYSPFLIAQPHTPIQKLVLTCSEFAMPH